MRREEARRVRQEEAYPDYREDSPPGQDENLWDLMEKVPQARRDDVPYGYGGEAPAAYGRGAPAAYRGESPAAYGGESPAAYGVEAPYGYGEEAPYGYGGEAPYGPGDETLYGLGDEAYLEYQDMYSQDGSKKKPMNRKAEKPGKRKAEASRDRKEAASRDRKEAASRDRKEAASRDRKEVAARDRKEAASRDRKEAASRDRKEAAIRDREAAAARNRKKEASRESARDRKRAREIERERQLERERERQRDKKRGRSKAAAIIALIIVFLLAFTGLRVWLESRPGAVEPIVGGADGLVGEDRINVLFLGTNQGLSDTTMVFSFDLKNKRLDEISIPRDTYYYRASFPGPAYRKFNSIYSSEGYEAACRAASDVLGGIAIHYYAELEGKGVAKIVDAMGGIEMDVPINMDYEDPNQDLYIHLKAGRQRLNGDQAMQYLRFRSGYNNADLGRIDAQQGFLRSVLSQSEGFDLPKIALVASNEAKSNLSMTAALALMTRAGGLKDWEFNSWTIPGTTGMQDGLSYFFHDPEGTKEMMRQIYGADSQAEE